MKRSFADFQDTRGDPIAQKLPRHTFLPRLVAPKATYDTPPASSPSDEFQSHEYPRNITAESSNEDQPTSTSSTLLLLRRSKSLPTLRELRTLQPFTPLTSQNLRRMDPTLPMTPQTSTSKSRSTTSTSISKDNGRWMGLVGILDCDRGSEQYELRPHLQDAVQRIIGVHRTSVTKPESARKFASSLNKFQGRNEATLASRLMPFLIKEGRAVPTPPDDLDESNPSIPTSTEVGRDIIRSFELDYLDWNIDKDFTPNSVPFPSNERGLPSKFGVKNPKPDITYGFQSEAFNSEHRRALLDFEPQLSTGIESPFLVVQWKGFQGSILKAKEQARRDGAAMVWSRRKAIARLGLSLTAEDVIAASMVFSSVVNTDVAHIHVHWGEILKDEVDLEWHIAIVARYHMNKHDIGNLRRDLHNILDWGLNERLQLVKSQVDMYRSLELIPIEDERSGKRKRLDVST